MSSRCLHCYIELREDEELLCEPCGELPRCNGCAMLDFELCEECSGWEERLTDQCWRCESKIGQNVANYKKYGNMCIYCDVEINEKLGYPQGWSD